MLVTHAERPRELKWYHAGPMLYGDWGTSRFYVLGLALFFSLHASLYYVVGIGILVAAVGWAYTIICRCYPDGGGVYSAAKHTNRQLAVVGALLLFADYIVTAALSAYDGIRYMGMDKSYVPYAAMGAILLVGLINYIGPRKAGTVALVIAMATLILTVILTGFCIPHLSPGWAALQRPHTTIGVQWIVFVNVVLALSGVEAIANMTGIMVPPVTKTANKAIWPVLIEVVAFNLILGIAMNALPSAGYTLGSAPGEAYQNVAAIQAKYPDWKTNAEAQAHIDDEASRFHVDKAVLMDQTPELEEHISDSQDAVLRVMAKVYVDPYMTLHVGSKSIGVFSLLCGFVFGLLLLSAVNTAVADMVSIQYVMSRDTEMPHVLTKLNKFGVPWLALIAAVGLPIGVLCIFQDLNTLANLYAVGVVGAIAINLGSCTVNAQMPVKVWERVGMGILAAIMLAIEITLVCKKPDARYFALFVLSAGLIARFFTKTYPLLKERGRGMSLGAWALLLVAIAGMLHHFEPAISPALRESVKVFQWTGGESFAMYTVILILLLIGGASANYSAQYLTGRLQLATLKGSAGTAIPEGFAGPRALPATDTDAEGIDLSGPHVLVATRGGRRLIDFAASYCRKTQSSMFVLFVRQINVIMSGPTPALDVKDDDEALKAFAIAAEIGKAAGVRVVPIYVASSEVPYTILDFATTYGVEAVLMGVSREGTLLKALRGDVITQVAEHLPPDIPLLIHA